MASAHIEVNGTGSRLNQQLRSFIDRLQEVQDDAERLKATLDQVALGADWEALQTALNLESAADAETIYNLFGSAEGELDGAFINQLLSRLG